MSQADASATALLESEQKRARLLRIVWGIAGIASALAVFTAATLVLMNNVPLLWHPGADSPLRIPLEAIASAAAATGLFGLFYTAITQTDFRRETETALVTVLGANPALFNRFSPATKRLFVEGALQSSLDERLGTIVFEEIVSPYLTAEIPLRSNYEYEIEALEGQPPSSTFRYPAVGQIDQTFRALGPGYLWLSQAISYTRVRLGAVSSSHEEYEICFAMDTTTLQALLQDHVVFFREVLELDSDQSNAIRKLTNDEAGEFVEKILKLRVTAVQSGDPVPYKVSMRTAKDQAQYISVLCTKVAPGQSIKVAFTHPQLRGNPWAIISLPQPCHEPRIRFRRNNAMTKLEPVTFLSNFKADNVTVSSAPQSEADPKEFEVKVSGWVFPTCGMMFTWRYK